VQASFNVLTWLAGGIGISPVTLVTDSTSNVSTTVSYCLGLLHTVSSCQVRCY